MHRPPSDLRGLDVGHIILAPTFTVSPLDVLAAREAEWLARAADDGDDVVRVELARRTPSPRGPVPSALLVRSAVAAVVRTFAVARAGACAHACAVERVRQWADAIPGEPLTAVGVVRYRRGSVDEAVHLTLDIDIHRRNGQTLARLRLGVEVPRPRGDAPASASASRRAAVQALTAA